MNVELLTIGDELLLGFTIDTNAAYIARQLAALGVRIVRRATVGDDASAIADAVRDALDRTGAVITTGGLGPTSDDLTKPSIARLFDRDLVADEALWEALRARWRQLGRSGEIPEINRQQIMIPRGAEVLPRGRGQDGVALHADHVPGQQRQDRGVVARAGADVEHGLVPAERQQLAHPRHHDRLGDRLPLGDRQ